MSLFKRGNVWWFKFKFAGGTVRESSKSSSKDVARRAEQQRRRELEEGYNHLPERRRPLTFGAAAAAWVEERKLTWAPKTLVIEQTSIGHLKPTFGSGLLTDIGPGDIADYQRLRRARGAAPKTVNNEVGTLRAILRRHGLWARLQPHVRMCA